MRRIIGGLLLRGLRSRKADTGRQILYVTVCWHKKDLEEVHEKMLDLLLPVPLATCPSRHRSSNSGSCFVYAREIFSKVSTTWKRLLSSAESAALPGLSTTRDFIPAAIAASTSLTLSLRKRMAAGSI